MSIATVLIGEDEVAARNSLAALLEDAGLRVLTASNGSEALSRILHEEPDAVLLDIRMPELDGLSVFKTIIVRGLEFGVPDNDRGRRQRDRD